jgi:hypothetical protein
MVVSTKRAQAKHIYKGVYTVERYNKKYIYEVWCDLRPAVHNWTETETEIEPKKT